MEEVAAFDIKTKAKTPTMNPLSCIGILERYLDYFLTTCVIPCQSEISPYLERAQWICDRLNHPLIKKTFITGSFGRDTTIRPLNDVDIFAVIYNSESITESDSKVFFTKIVEVLSVGGYVVEIPGQVALWQVFLPPNMKFLLRKQRVSVRVCFTAKTCWDADEITCDIVPAFETDREDIFHIQTPASGLQTTQPKMSMLALNKMDTQWNGELRSLIRLFKYWNQRNRVTVKPNEPGIKMLQSFMIETQIMEFARQCSSPMKLLSALPMAFSFVSSSLIQDAAVVIPGWEDAFLHHHSIKAVAEGISLQSISARLHACAEHCEATTRAFSIGDLHSALTSLCKVFGDEIVTHFPRYLNTAAQHLSVALPPPSSNGDDMTYESVLRAVSVAAYRSDIEALRSLLSREQVTGSTQTELAPHSAAVLGGHLDVLQELVKHGYDVNSCADYVNFPPLAVAAREDRLEIAKWLLEASADPNCGFPLDISIARGSLPMVQLLVAAGANPNGIMALALSIEQEQDEIFTCLLNNRADVDYTSENSPRTPLHIASIVGNVKAVCSLLKEGADPNHSDGKTTPLISAISRSHTEIALQLINNGADVNACPSGGLAPLQVAASMKLDHVVSSLLQRRASILPRDPTRPSQVFTGAKLQCSLSRAILSGAVDAVRALLAAKYDPNGYGYESSPLFHAVYAQSIECVKILLECKGVEINRANPSTGRTALHIAATRGEQFVSLLLESKANPNVFDINGATPLYAYADVGNVACARYLLNKGALVNLNPSPLLMASMRGHTELVEVLLDHKADVNFAEPTSQKTALHLAAINGHVDVTTLLLKHGASHGDIMSEGSTPIHCAAFCGHAAVASLLIKAGSNVNKPSTENQGSGQTPLMNCVIMGYTHILKLLLQHGAVESVDVADESGESPLFTASYLGFKDVVEILLENGANPNAMTPNGSTAFATASIHGRSDICALLYERDHSSCDTVLGDGRESCLLLALSLKHKDLSEKLVHWSSLETLQRKNAKGHTPALLAVKNGYLSVFNELHDRLQFKTEESCEGPRWWLEREGMDNEDLFLLFLQHIDDGEIEAIEWYLKEGLVNVNENQLPIIMALRANHPEVVRLLIAHGSVLEMKVNEVTLPTFALINSQWEVLYHLVASGRCDIGQTLAVIVQERLAKGMDVLKRARPDLDIDTFRHSHLGVTCDGCLAEGFTSTRYKHIKENVDYCYECYQKLLSQDLLDVNQFKVVDPPSWFVEYFSFYK